MNFTDDKKLIEAINLVNQQKQLTEALSTPAQKSMATKASNESKDSSGLTAAERISKDVMSSDKIVIPFTRMVQPDKAVVQHLSNNGFHIHDYESGLAYHINNPSRKIRIGKILNLTKASDSIKQKFEKDPSRQGINTEGHVVISRNKHHVAASSTNQAWESCTALGGKCEHEGETTVQKRGAYADMMPGIIKAGTHIAYLVKHPDDIDKHFAPIARTFLNVYVNPESGHKILRASNEYGDHWGGFVQTVNKWAEQNFPTKHPAYIRSRESYPEGPSRVYDYSPEHDDKMIRQHLDDDEMIRNHPRSDFLDKATDYLLNWHKQEKFHNPPRQLLDIMRNPNTNKETEDKIVKEISRNGRIDDVAGIVDKIKHPENIQKMLDRAKSTTHYRTALAVASNRNATKEQLHEVNDVFGAGQTNVPGVRRLAHEGFSPTVIQKIAMNPNADDSHFKSILQLDELTPSHPKHETVGSFANHDGTLEAIARYHKDPEIAKQLIAIGSAKGNQPEFHQPRVINAIADKHPELLSSVSNQGIFDALQHSSASQNLVKHVFERFQHAPQFLGMAINRTEDPKDLEKYENHPNPGIRDNVRIRKLYFDSKNAG